MALGSYGWLYTPTVLYQPRLHSFYQIVYYTIYAIWFMLCHEFLSVLPIVPAGCWWCSVHRHRILVKHDSPVAIIYLYLIHNVGYIIIIIIHLYIHGYGIICYTLNNNDWPSSIIILFFPFLHNIYYVYYYYYILLTPVKITFGISKRRHKPFAKCLN